MLLVLIGVVVAILAAIPKEMWILLAVVSVVLLVVWAANKAKFNTSTNPNPTNNTKADQLKNPKQQSRTQSQATTEAAISAQPVRNMANNPESQDDRTARELEERLSAIVRERLKINITVSTTGSDQPVTVGSTSGSGSYSIPRPTTQRTPDAKWIKPGERVTVQGVSFDCGMVYLGSCLPAAYNENDPCLIDPSLSVAARATAVADMGYWPSYARILATARRKYLEWLAGGRNDRSIDIGYVFLFYYGLERRVLIDGAQNDEARSELNAITKEIERLLEIHGSQSPSFQRYAFGLLDVIRSASVGEKLYAQPIPALPETYELPHYLKLALGQASKDKAPVSADLALAWAEHHPGIYFRTAAQRCESEFNQLFRLRYTEKYGEGMLLPHNRTKLKCMYRPASSGFRGQAELTLPSSDLPDVTAVNGPIDALAELVKRTTEELDPYSRLLGKTPEAKETAAARMLLPLPLWPPHAAQRFDDLRQKVKASLLVMKVSDLFGALDLQVEPERKTMLHLARHLSSIGIAVEPDIESGARTPKSEDHIVLFGKPNTSGSDPENTHYKTAQLTLQLAAMVAMADGEFNEQEQMFIEQQIAAWSGLTDADRIRLHAHMKLMVVAPGTMSSLKKRIQELGKEARESIAGYMASLASTDGMITPDEVRVIEKAYKALGLEATNVFTNLHATSPGRGASIRQSVGSGFQLDHERVRALQHESQQVSQLLAGIFTDEESTSKDNEEPVMRDKEPTTGILGLDHQHSTLAHLLLSRPVWSRNELADAAADLDLMLEGALERINEASFDLFDQPLFEGDDPLEVDQTMIDRLRHEPAHSST